MKILHIVLDTPLDRAFDYLAPDPPPPVGVRVRVPFGKQGERTGFVIGHADQSEIAAHKLKAVTEVLDQKPLWDESMFKLVQWAARYYHHPLGQAVSTALPALLNRGEAAALPVLQGWRVNRAGRETDVETLKRAPVQRGILELLREQPQGLNSAEIAAHYPTAQRALRELEKKSLLERIELPIGATVLLLHGELKSTPLALNSAQAEAVAQVQTRFDGFWPCLLHGVTGSGKTEVYLQIIAAVLEQDRQALVLVPEINLTPQMLARFERRFRVPIAVLHSRLNDRERLTAWLLARSGEAAIVIGTRSAIWTPLARPGVIVVDEEHDSSYKQDTGLHYSARDLALVRAQLHGVPVVLGSATPALESLHNAMQERYHHLILPQRAGSAKPPHIQIVDMRSQFAGDNLSKQLIHALRGCLEQKQQALLFVTRRGYAPVLMCHHCGWIADCRHCNAHLTLHLDDGRLHCHHCGATQKHHRTCPACKETELRSLGHGTERIEESLARHFPEARMLRIDSDSTRRKQAMHNMLAQIESGEADILVGTQMLAKGHHFPNVTLVGIINLDGGLFSTDFRAGEHTAQLLVQVAGRAGRAQHAGTVLIQTWHPQHPLLQQVLGEGYSACVRTILDERRAACLPPFSHLALLRAETGQESQLTEFLEYAKAHAEAQQVAGLQYWGPVAAPLDRRAGRHRGQLLLQADRRDALHTLLERWLPELRHSTARGVSWSLDVDPLDLF